MPRALSADRRCVELAQTQQGIFTAEQALDAGLSRRALLRRVTSGLLERDLPDVYGVAGAPRTWRRDLLAAVFWLGLDTVASHRAAARMWRLEGFDEAPVEVSTTRSPRVVGPTTAAGAPIIVHRVDWRLLPRTTAVDGIPVTTVPRTLIDLAGIKHRRVERALDEALRRGLVSLADLWDLVERQWMSGRRGVRVLRRLLIPRTQGRAPSDSDLQVLFSRVVKRWGLPEPEREYRIRLPQGTIHLDAAYPEGRLGIELDGYAWHADRRAFEGDRARDNELRALGWTVLRFTWTMLRYHDDDVARLVAVHLR